MKVYADLEGVVVADSSGVVAEATTFGRVPARPVGPSAGADAITSALDLVRTVEASRRGRGH